MSNSEKQSSSSSWFGVAAAAISAIAISGGIYLATRTSSSSSSAPAATPVVETVASGSRTPRSARRAAAPSEETAAVSSETKPKRKSKAKAVVKRDLLLLILEDVQQEMIRALENEPAFQVSDSLSQDELEDMFTELSERIDAKVAAKHGVTEEAISEACSNFASDDQVSAKLGQLASMQAAFFDNRSSHDESGPISAEQKEILYAFHEKYQGEVIALMQGVKQLRIEKPTLSDTQLRQYLQMEMQNKGQELAAEIGMSFQDLQMQLVQACKSDPAFTARIQRLSQELNRKMSEVEDDF